MKNKYIIVLAAGSRVFGTVQYGSTSEELHAKQLLNDFLTKYKNSITAVYDKLGFIEIELTEEEAYAILSEAAVLEIELTKPIVRYTSQFDSGYGLSCLSNDEYHPTGHIITGYEIELINSGGLTNCDRTYYTSDLLEIIPGLGVHHYGPKTFKAESAGNVIRLKPNLNLYTLDKAQIYFETTEFTYFDLTVTTVDMSDTTINFEEVLLYIVISKETGEVSTKLIGQITSLYIVIGQVNRYTEWYWSNNYPVITSDYSNLELYQTNSSSYNSKLTGKDVYVYIVDEIMDTSHEEFNGRAEVVYNPFSAFYLEKYGNSNYVPGDHGTAVASNAAGIVCGVAKDATIKNIVIIDGSDTLGLNNDATVATVNWVLTNHDPNIPAVLNFSWGYQSVVSAVDYAVQAVINDGFMVVLAAGNSGLIQNYSPYSPDAIYIAAHTKALEPASFTNFGSRVTAYSPGENVLCAKSGGTYELFNGTSMSAPFVTGLCALMLQLYPKITPAELKSNLLRWCRPDILNNKELTTDLRVAYPQDIYIERDIVELSGSMTDRVVEFKAKLNDLNNEFYSNVIEVTTYPVSSVITCDGSLESVELSMITKLIN